MKHIVWLKIYVLGIRLYLICLWLSLTNIRFLLTLLTHSIVINLSRFLWFPSVLPLTDFPYASLSGQFFPRDSGTASSTSKDPPFLPVKYSTLIHYVGDALPCTLSLKQCSSQTKAHFPTHNRYQVSPKGCQFIKAKIIYPGLQITPIYQWVHH